VRRIVLAANRQKRLVEDLLLLSQLETTGLAPNMEAIDLIPLVEQAIEEAQGSYHGQTINATGAGFQRIFADASRALQIIANLLDNAAKYSPKHSPIAICWQEENGMVVIRVIDTGPGLGEDGRERLFTRFGRIRGSKMRAGRSGTGLGLFIGRRLAEAMHGTLDLETTGEQGSTFRLALRAEPLNRATPRIGLDGSSAASRLATFEPRVPDVEPVVVSRD
jgi:signal transduction histidine kinase